CLDPSRRATTKGEEASTRNSAPIKSAFPNAKIGQKVLPGNGPGFGKGLELGLAWGLELELGLGVRSPRDQSAELAVLNSSQHFSCAGAIQARLQDLLTWSFSEASLLQLPINPVTDMEQRSPRVPKLAWLEEEEGPGAAPAEETGLRGYSYLFKIKSSAALLDMFVEEGFSNPKQVPAMVRYIHQWLLANEYSEHKLFRTLLDLTKAQPADVVMTLLRVAPSCDRAALSMWKTIMCSPRTAKLAQLMLLCVLEDWPEHSTCTSDGDKTGVFALAVLQYLDLSKCSGTVLEILSKNLWSECRERRRLALRGLVVLGKNPPMAKKMWNLTESLVVELLQESDGDIIRMSIVLLKYLFLYNGVLIPSPIALRLAEALLPLFDNDDSQVQLCAMFVFQDMMVSLTEEGRKVLKSHVRQSLLPLSFHCHDQNQCVVEAARETLHSSARFLKRRDLEQMLQVDQTWRFGEGLVRDWKPQPQPGQALECTADDSSPTVRNLAIETALVLRAVQRAPYSVLRKLQDQLRRAQKTQPRLSGLSWLRCWSSVES
ncbi:hypothetical protein HGM15179_020639, partial [Zosterops borbonicus]